MQFKKFALRGMIILAVVIALCILFSGTLRTLTTAKVRFVEKKTGKIEQSADLTGKVVFPEESPYTLTVPEGLSLTVSKVHVVNGQKVKAGELLLSLEVTEVEAKMTELQKDYEDALSELDEWTRKNGDIRLSRNEQLWMEAYNAAREAESEELEIRLALMAELDVSKTSKLTEKNVSKGSETAKELYAQWQEAVKTMEAAQKKQAGLNRYAIDEDTWKVLQSKQASQKKQKDAEDKMVKIRRLQKQVGEIRAEYDGYVIEVKVEKGSSLTGANDLLLFSKQGVDPVIRAETKDLEQPIQKGAEITIVSEESNGRKVKTKVKATGVTEKGTPCADAEITDDVIYELGSVSKMMQLEKIPMKVVTRSKETSFLVPVSAVRGSGDSCYVFTAEPQMNALGESVLKVAETPVTVQGRNESYVAIQEDYLMYGNTNIIYMEDRPISKGDTVMQYEGASQK